MKQIRFIVFPALMILMLPFYLAAEEPGYTDTPFLPHSKWRVHDKSRPQPAKVVPGVGDLGATPPSDALVLFDGTSLQAWTRDDGSKPGDGIATDGSFDIGKTGQLLTKQEFGDCQLHVEWLSPPEDASLGRMNWGNSGVFMMGRFEIQIIESCSSYIYADGNAGAIYGQCPPLVNPARKPGEWQSFDIFFIAPRFDGETLLEPARVTVIYNGIPVQIDQAIVGETLHSKSPGPYSQKMTGPIKLQEHRSAVKFRNIWVRPLTMPDAL